MCDHCKSLILRELMPLPPQRPNLVTALGPTRSLLLGAYATRGSGVALQSAKRPALVAAMSHDVWMLTMKAYVPQSPLEITMEVSWRSLGCQSPPKISGISSTLSSPHKVLPFQGQRVSLSLFSPEKVHMRLTSRHWKQLRQLRFPTHHYLCKWQRVLQEAFLLEPISGKIVWNFQIQRWAVLRL